MTRDWFEKEKEIPSNPDGDEGAKAQARLQAEAIGTREVGTAQRLETAGSAPTGTGLETGTTGRPLSEVAGTRGAELNTDGRVVQPGAGTPGKIADTAIAREPGTTAVPRPAETPAPTDAPKVPGGQPGAANPPVTDATTPAQPKPASPGGAVAEVATNLLGTAVHRLEGAAVQRLEAAINPRHEGGVNPRHEGTGNPRLEVTVNPRSETPVNVRLEGHVSVPRVVGEAAEVIRAVRAPEELARDRKTAETTFRTSETLEGRVTAGTMLEALRREVRAIEQGDPAYSAKVQEAYRAILEGRGVVRDRPDGLPNDASRPQQPMDRQPIPVRPGDGLIRGPVEDRQEIRRSNEAGTPGRDRGVLAVDLSPLAGINFGDRNTRAVFIDILKRVDAGTFKLEQLDAGGRRVFDAAKGFDPNRLEQIKQFFTNDVQGAGRQRLDDATIVRRVQEILEGGKDAFTQRRPFDATESATTMPRTATERLVDFMRTNRDVILGQALDQQASKAALVDLARIVRDINKELGLDPTKGGITLKDVLARNLEGTGKAGSLEGTARAGEKAIQERLPAIREEVLVARLNPAQEAAFKAALERGAKPEAAAIQTERRPETARVEASTQVSQRVAQMEGRPGEARPLDARIAAEDASRAGMRAEQPAARPEMTVKPELAGKPEPGARDLGGRPESTVPRLDTTAGAQPAKAGDVGGQPADQVRIPGRTDITDRSFEDDKKTKKAEESEKEREQDQKVADAALAALLAARKAKEEKERAEKEKEKAQEKDKKEPERRQRYVVKEKDTLDSIAAKMLRDARLAPLILEINKSTIPIRQESGKSMADLRPAMVIWLPTTTDIRDFRGRLMGAAPAPATDQVSVPHTWGKELTPEEELAARFGGRAEEYSAEAPDDTGDVIAAGKTGSTSGESVEDMTLGAIAAAKARRANVETMLGPLSSRKDEAGRIKYTVRLGNTLKSVAINHPGLKDVGLWKLLAEVNNLSTETDSKDIPLVRLERGTTVLIPSPKDIHEYRTRQMG